MYGSQKKDGKKKRKICARIPNSCIVCCDDLFVLCNTKTVLGQYSVLVYSHVHALPRPHV